MHEAHSNLSLGSAPLRDLGLRIAGSPLEPILQRFQQELLDRGLTRVRPHFYLSTEWGVPFGTISIAIPFYLARVDLKELHADRHGHIEGANPEDILRYLRHEMGHVVNYAYRLYETPEWTALFGDIDQPYIEEYHPQPFHRDYVAHLPGWYAQKHPDEDWAETFAVWLTPGFDWRRRYAGAPVARAKLEYCDRTLHALRDRDPLVAEVDADEDVGDLTFSLDQLYQTLTPGEPTNAADLDEALQTLLRDVDELPSPSSGNRPLHDLLRRLERTLMASIYRWTGHFPERTRVLLRHLADCAGKAGLVYSAEREAQVVAALATFVTALAMNHVQASRAPAPPALSGPKA